jgi:hypothetical protein
MGKLPQPQPLTLFLTFTLVPIPCYNASMSNHITNHKLAKWGDWVAGLVLTLIALLVYGFTLAPTVLPADAGEFQFVSWLPGIAHPTGYPLYTMLGWLWTHIFPIGQVAWRMNLLSAIFAAVAVGVTYGVARQLVNKTLPDTPLPARIVAALIAAATFAITPTFWSQAIIAEVYALHALLVVLILWLTLLTGTAADAASWPAKLLTLTFGLGLTHHRTTILLLPAVILFLIISDRKNPSPSRPVAVKIKLALIHAALFVVPLLLYLYLPLIAPTTPYANLSLSTTQTLTLYDNSFHGFWQHITGSVFAGELQPDAVGMARLALVWQLLLQQIGWIGLGLAMIGVITLTLRRQYDLLLLTGLAALSFVAFNLIYFIGDVFVLFIPVWLVMCLWIGVGSLGLAHWLAGIFVRQKTRPREGPATFARMERQLAQRVYRLLVVALLSIGLVGYVVALGVKNSTVDQSDNTATRERWQDIMAESLPANAILMSNDRNEMMPMWYYQYVEQWRPDLIGLFPLIVTDPAYANVGRVLDEALASSRPVYFIKPMDGLSLKANLTPTGTLVLAQPVNPTPAHSVDLVLPEIAVNEGQTETIKIWGYDGPAGPVKSGDVIDITLYWQPVQNLTANYSSFVHLINNNGQGITQSDHRPGGDFYPSSLWQPGEILRDQHSLILPDDLPAGTYQYQIGMYIQPDPGVIRGMGGGLEIGLLVVASE